MHIEDLLIQIVNELRELNAKFAHIGGAVAPAPAPKPASEPASERASQPAPEPASGPAPAPVELDYERDVLPVAREFLAKRGRDELASVLKNFGVGTARELQRGQLAPFVEALHAGLR